MKYTPLVRMQTMPVIQANTIETAIATGREIERVGDARGGQYPNGIGAQADERCLTERDQAAIADQQIERDRGDREHHDARAGIDEVMLRGQRSENGKQRKSRKYDGR